MTSIQQIIENSGSDKGSYHSYAAFYDELLTARRNEIKSVVEFGVYAGRSIEAWHGCFPNAHIFGVDTWRAPDLHSPPDRFTLILGDCMDEQTWQPLKNYGLFDFSVDDCGDHNYEMQHHIICRMMPILAPKGIHVIEDVKNEATAIALATEFNGTIFDRRTINNVSSDILVVITRS